MPRYFTLTLLPIVEVAPIEFSVTEMTKQELRDKYRYERQFYIGHPVIDVILSALNNSYDVAEGSDVDALADQVYIALHSKGLL